MKNRSMFIILATVVIFGPVGCTSAAKTITIKGSTTVLSIAQSCSETYMDLHTDTNISVQGGGSGVGIASVIDGTCDIGNASRSVKDKEIATAKEKGVVLHETVVAMDGIAVIVNPLNKVIALKQEQIKDIYTGKINNWKDVGGEDMKIVVVSRDSSSGTYETFNELALEGEKVRPDALLNASNRAVATTVANTPAAIGYIGIGFLGPSVKDVEVDGVKASNENVLNGSYPLARKLFMYTNGKPGGTVMSFIDFVLSGDGQKLVDKAGFIALN